MANFYIDNTPDGYVVKWHDIEHGVWRPLRNFGDRQTDAIEYRDYDCPHFEEYQLRSRAKSYKAEYHYQRIKFRHYKKTQEDNYESN